MNPFANRRQAGAELARSLMVYAGRPDVVVLALPRGGVPVAYEIAQALRVALDVFVVRKLGVPGQEELAMGAIASGGVRILDSGVIRSAGVSQAEIDRVAGEESAELKRREHAYRADRPALALAGRTVILVDDGLATGSSMRAAVAALEPLAPARIVIAVPVSPRSTARLLGRLVDEFVCLATPDPFHAVGAFYRDFGQTDDQEVRDLLSRPTVPAGPQEAARADRAS